MKAFEWLRRKVTAIKTMNGERLTKKEVVVTDSLNAHPSALNSNGETLLVRAERYLWERYEFRYNVLAKCYEVAPSSSPKGEDFRVLDDEQRTQAVAIPPHAPQSLRHHRHHPAP